jgi:PIN domain nuclease of toxin-antitoxin system
MVVGSGVVLNAASCRGGVQHGDTSSRHPLSDLLVLGSKRLADFPWLDRYRPWGVSPVALLEIQFLAEVGRLSVRNPDFTNTVMDDTRFIVDDISLATLVRHGLRLDWTRDPFDRLLTAHSSARRVPLCTTDRDIRSHHRLLPIEVDE